MMRGSGGTMVSSLAAGILALRALYPALLPAPPRDESARGSLRVIPYVIDAETAADTAAELLREGPVDELGRRRYARAEWSVRWKRPAGGPAAWRDAVVEYDIRLMLPVLRTASEQLRTRWDLLAYRIAVHELNHARHVIAAAPRLAAEIRTAAGRGEIRSDSDAHRIGSRYLSRMRNADLRYDAETRHGLSEGISWKILEGPE